MNKETEDTITKYINNYESNTYLDKYSKGFKAQLKKNRQYFKYLDYKYRSNFKALYQNTKPLLYKKAKALLVKINKKIRENIVKKN